MKTVVLPELGEGIEKAVIASWLFKPGQKVEEGDDLVELVTDKASFNVPSPCRGVLRNILIKENQEAAVGAVLAFLDDNDVR